MKHRGLIIAAIAAGLTVSISASAEEVVGQKGKAFTVKQLSVKVGESVAFENNDPFTHNIYSLSDAKSFDLGSYPQGESRSVTFDQAGTIEVGCAIHMDMSMVIEVQE